MKKLLISCIAALVSLTVAAQTNLTGRIYTNSNIMADAFEKEMAGVELKIDSMRNVMYTEFEKKKGRKMNESERKEAEARIAETKKMMEAVKKGVKTSISFEFKDTKNVLMRCKMSVDDNALKLAGIPWAKRKLMKAAMTIAPSTEKATYRQHGNTIIIDDEEDADTLRLSNDGKYIYGTFEKNVKYKLTRTQ